MPAASAMRSTTTSNACAASFGVATKGVGKGQPRLETDRQAADYILGLSGTTNGLMATEGFRTLERPPAMELADLSAEHEGKRCPSTMPRPHRVPVITSPSGPAPNPGVGATRRSPINVEEFKPWHSLTGRYQFYIDHDWLIEMGDALPTFRPPLDMNALFGEAQVGESDGTSIAVRYLTPHNKWAIHSMYQENFLHDEPGSRRADDLDERRGRRGGRASPTTIGSRRSTATASSPPVPWSRTGCRRERPSSTTHRNARSMSP